MEIKNRKNNRLKNYDYSSEGYYYITVCTANKQKILGEIVGDGACDIPRIEYFANGKVVDKYIKKMNNHFDGVSVDKYIIMPNHIHLILRITKQEENGSSQAPNPTNAIIPKFISLFKRYCNKEIGKNIFQRSYYDRVVRSESEYKKIWEYIDSNPCKWAEDKYYK